MSAQTKDIGTAATLAWCMQPAPETVEDIRDEEAFEENAIAKEPPQNGKDAQSDPNKPARVRYTLRQVEQKVAEKYTAGIKEHLQACHDDSPNLYSTKDLNGACVALLIEDFNTTGLLGPLRHERELKNRPNNFVALMYSSGSKYTKKGNNLGSRGQGKNAYTTASSIRCWIAFTVRVQRDGQNDPNPRVLFGRTTLRSHYVGDSHFSRNGHWGLIATDEKGVTRAQPVTDDQSLDQFVADFNLARKSSEAGTSIVILYYKGDRSLESFVLRQIQENYALILHKGLELEFDFPGAGIGAVASVSAINVEDQVRARVEPPNSKTSDWKDLLTKLEDLKWMLEVVERNTDVISCPQPSSGTNVDNYIKSLPTDLTKRIVDHYREFGHAAFRLPVTLHERTGDGGSESRQGEMIIAVVKDASGGSHWPEFLRDGLRIAPAQGRSMVRNKVAGVRTIFSVRGGLENGMQVLLRASEPGAHDRWDPNTAGFRESWEHGEAWINFAKQAPSAFADLARGISDELNHDAFPFIADPKTDDTGGGGGGGDGGDDGGDGGDGGGGTGGGGRGGGRGGRRIPRVLFESVQRSGKVGFKATLSKGAKCATIEIKACYDNAQGKAMDKYDKADFDFADMRAANTITISGGTIISASENKLIISVQDAAKLEVEVLGFNDRLILIPEGIIL